MKNWLNLGVSDPLTLGMAHPIADRLETLGRARPVTTRTRAVALGLTGVAAMLTAPITIAADHPDVLSRFSVRIDGNEMRGQSYEIVTESGERKAYRILKNGDREPATLEKRDDGTLQLTYADGQTVNLPSFDFEALDGLESLKGLEALRGLQSLEGLKGLQGLSALSHLEGLSNLDGMSRIIINKDDFDLAGVPDSVKIIVGNTEIEVNGDGSTLDENSRSKLQNLLRGAVKNRISDGLENFEWVEDLKFGDGGDVQRFVLDRNNGAVLNDTIVSGSAFEALDFGPTPEFFEDVDAEIDAVMADKSINIRMRKAKARRMKAGALQSDFRQANPNATAEQRFENCIAILDTLNRDYRYHKQSDRGESAQSKCERSNMSVRSSFVWSSSDETQ